MTTKPLEFLVRKDDLHTADFSSPSDRTLGKNQVRLEVEAFALTANNITYAVFGDAMQYWSFFPARDGWGTIPVWGLAVVERSEHPQIAVGERIYGYLPMSTHLDVTADKVSPGSFTDVAAHRSGLPIFYN